MRISTVLLLVMLGALRGAVFLGIAAVNADIVAFATWLTIGKTIYDIVRDVIHFYHEKTQAQREKAPQH